MSTLDQERNSLMDFAALGAKLRDLLRTQEQIERFLKVESDRDSATAYQQEASVIFDQIRRLRNSLAHSPLEDVIKKLSINQDSAREAVLQWDFISRSMRDSASASEAIRKLNEATKEISTASNSNEFSKQVIDYVDEAVKLDEAISSQRTAEKLRDALLGLDEAKKTQEALRGIDELKKAQESLRGIDELKKAQEALRGIDELKKAEEAVRQLDEMRRMVEIAEQLKKLK